MLNHEKPATVPGQVQRLIRRGYLPLIFRAPASSARIEAPGSPAVVIKGQTACAGSASSAAGQATGTVDRPTIPSTSLTTSLLECGNAKPRPTPVEPSDSRWSTWHTTRPAFSACTRPD